jgi:hypothetical protein
MLGKPPQRLSGGSTQLMYMPGRIHIMNAAMHEEALPPPSASSSQPPAEHSTTACST